MSEDALIRYENLDAIVKARQWGPTELAAAVDRSPSYCSDMLRRKKSFGEGIARHIERKLGLPRAWLDEPHDVDDRWLIAPLPLGESEASYNVTHTSPGKTQGDPSANSDKTWLRAPVVVWGRLGVDLYRANTDWPADELRGFAAARPSEGARFKLVPVPDDELGPRISKGDLIAIDPDNVTARRNQVVLLRAADDQFLLRRYVPLADGSFEAVDSAGRALDATRHGLVVVGVAVGLIPHDL